MSGPTRLLTVVEAAERLAVSRRTLQGWIASGTFPVVRLSARCVRVRPEDLEAFIEAAGKTVRR